MLKTWPAAATTDDMVESLRTLGNLGFGADIATAKINWLDKLPLSVNEASYPTYNLANLVWEIFFKGTLSYYPGHDMNTKLLCSSRKYVYPLQGSSLEMLMGWGSQKPKSLCRKGVGSFWNNTVLALDRYSNTIFIYLMTGRVLDTPVGISCLQNSSAQV